MTVLSKLLIAASTIALTACSTVVAEKVEVEQKSVSSRMAVLSQEWQNQTDTMKTQRSSVLENLYVAPFLIKNEFPTPLPSEWLVDMGYWQVAGVSTIYDVAKALRFDLNVPVQIRDQLPVDFDQGQIVQQIQQGDQAEEAPLPSTSRANANVQDILNRRQMVQVSGSWRERLDQIAALYKVKWSYKGGAILFDFFETETFPVHHTAGAYTINSSVEDVGGTEGGVNGSGRQSASILNEFNMWEEVVGGIRGIVPAFSAVVPHPATGGITVTTLADQMDDVREHVANLNARLSRQVAFTLDIYSVTFSDEENSAFNLNLAFQDLRDRFGFSFNGLSGVGAGQGSSLSASIITPPASSPFAEFAGSEVIAEAFRSVGDVSTVYSDNQIGKNYLPTSFQLTNQIGYIRQRQITVNPEGGTQVSVEPGVVSAGYKIQLLPSINADGTLTVRIAISISQLESLVSIGSPEQVIQTPNINVSDLLNELYVSSGSMIMLTGFEQFTNRTDNVNGALPCFFCADNSSEQERRKFYVVIRPHVLDAPKPLARGR